MNHFSLFCKSYLVQFLKCLVVWFNLTNFNTLLRSDFMLHHHRFTDFLGKTGSLWHCSRDFWSCSCESPALERKASPFMAWSDEREASLYA